VRSRRVGQGRNSSIYLVFYYFSLTSRMNRVGLVFFIGLSDSVALPFSNLERERDAG
jgi:hypothetical protein